MKKIIIGFLFVISTLSRAETPTALLMICTNLHQPDLRELTVIRDQNNDEQTVTMYLTDANNKLSIQKYDIENYREGLFILPDFVNLERQLQREEDGWHIYIYYQNKTLDKLVDCTESPE